MFKRSIKLFLLTCIIGLSSLINVNADTLYDKISPGDVIIGNTVFKGNTWISANRAAEAGSLYTLNTGKVNKNTYLYDDLEDWYKYNNDTEKYELLSSSEISEIQNKIHIYYENNKPLVNTYESYSLIEGDELLDANDVYWFFNEMHGEIFLDDENVELDYENETITCPYQYVFDFEVVANNEPVNFKGICGLEGFSFEMEEYYNLEKATVESIQLVSATENSDLLNQSKVNLNYSDGNNAAFSVTENLLDYRPSLSGESSTYVAIDINLSGKSAYEFVRAINIDVPFTILPSEDSIRLYLTVNSYGYTTYSFTLKDNKFGTFEEVYIYFYGLQRPEYNFVLENVNVSSDVFDQEMKRNNDSIHSIEIISSEEEHYFDTISVNTIGELSNSSFNDYPAKWFAFDLFFNDGVDYNYLNITFNGDYDANYDYEFLEDRIRFYVAFDGFMWLPITISDTKANQSLHFSIVINNYAEENYIVANNGFLGSYTHSSEGIEKIDTNYSSFYDLYYDSDNSRLYYTNAYDHIYLDNESLKMITTKTNDNIEEVVIENIDVMVVYNNGEQETWSSPTNLNNTTLYDSIINEIDENSELEVTIYTFFKPGKELTEAEQAEFDKFDSLVEAGKVEIIDISSSIYE